MSFLSKLLLTFGGFSGFPMANAVAAPFVHGCGTGCRVTAELISPVTQQSSLYRGTFRQRVTDILSLVVTFLPGDIITTPLLPGFSYSLDRLFR